VKNFGKDLTDQGIYDLTGNVREWCRDVWAPYTFSSDPVVDPQGPPPPGKLAYSLLTGRPPSVDDTQGPPQPGTFAAYVIRGGSYLSFADQFATTGPRQPDRGNHTVAELDQYGAARDLGFRLVIEWPPRP